MATATKESPADVQADEPETKPQERTIEDQLFDLETQCQEAERDHDRLKRETKEAKEFYDACVVNLRRAVRALHEELPLFDRQPESDDEAWRSYPIDDLGIPAGAVKKLAEANITTVGELADFTRGENSLTDIEGIGPAAAEKIESQLEWFWRDRPWESEEVAEDGEE